MTTMMSNLPRDLIEEIVSRLPLKYMKAVRLTCKSWNILSKNESFTKMHISKAATRAEKTMMIATTSPHSFYLMSVVVDDVDPPVELKGQLSFLHKEVSIYRVLNYEGLLLCILRDVTRIVVWNPFLGQTRWIKLRYSHRPQGWDKFRYALGYEDKESCRGVKFLRFLDYFYNGPETKFFWYEIYNFDSGLWTTLDVNPHWWILFSNRGVSLKGNTYWPARERSPQNGSIDHIICFDFTRERFGPLLPLPFEAKERKYEYVTLSCVKEEKLAALFQRHESYEYEFEIWITTKIEVETVSWSKFLRMDTGPKIGLPVEYFIDEEKSIFMGFEHRDYDYPKTFINIIREGKYIREMDLGVPEGQYCWLPVSYVPSLVQIKKPARGKRIEQSSLEEHRVAQNKLRLAAVEKLLPRINIYR